MWRIGSKLVRESSPEDGVGVVTAVEDRFIDVHFPLTDTRVRLSPEAAGISPFQFFVGTEVNVEGDERVIRSIRNGVATLDDDSVHRVDELWPVVRERTLVERLQRGDLDPVEDIIMRLDGYRLLNHRRKGLIPSLIGGRIELYPHQLDTAAKAISQETVRWLLADEVGLGKTIVAAMVRMGRVERALIIAPETLTVQWLGELYRKFHQVFVHIDEERVGHVRRDFGEDVDPFDIHPLGIVSFDLLKNHPELIENLMAQPPEMMVVDEAHRIIGTDIEFEILPLVQHALLLTATPFHSGARGFVRLLDVLDLPHEEEDGHHIARQVSVVTRDDIHDLGRRIPQPTPVDHFGEIAEGEPRVAWLSDQIASWKKRGERALIFVEDAERVKSLATILGRTTHENLFTFHEEMGTADRDVELARFRLSDSPALISSGAGSEGRNFQFCDYVVHFDLPIDPVVLEQRIGRVDRIGREKDIPIYYFKTDDKPGARARVYETIGIFHDPTIGSSPALSGLRARLAYGDFEQADVPAMLEEVLADVAIQADAWNFPDSHKKEESASVLAQIPEDFEQLVERFTYERAERLGLDIVEKEGFSVYFFEYGANVDVEAIPGIEFGQRFMGTFDRQEAVSNQLLDFFANGHPLVESLLNELEDSPQGRVGAIQVTPDEVAGLRGAFLFVVKGRGDVSRPELIPLAAVGATADSLSEAGQALFETLAERPMLARSQTMALAAKYVTDELDLDDTSLMLLVVAM